MVIVHSFSSIRCSKENLPVHIFTFTLSALYAKRSGFDIVLHTDEMGKHFLQHAPYDKIIVDIPTPPSDHRVFAWCKFVAMSNEDINAIHIDGDVFLKSPNLKDKLSFDDCDVICQNLEKIGVFPYQDSCWDKESYAWRNCYFPEWMPRKFNKMYNVGIIGFKDKVTRDEYHSLYNKMMKDFEKNGRKNECVPELVSEQKLLYDFANHKKLKVKCLLDYQNLMSSANANGYQHLLGASKYKCIDKTKSTLKKLDKDLYDKTVDVLQDIDLYIK